jgi:hypothetical protein
VSAPTIHSTSSSPAFKEHPPQDSAEPAREDLNALHYMLARLQEHFSPADGVVARAPILYLPEHDGRQHRIILLNSVPVHTGEKFTFVGFFGRKRVSADASLLDALDTELIQELYNYPHMLSYSSLELPDGSWGNLVLMSSPQGAIHWASSARHAYAAYHVAPASYSSIRLHSGVVTLNGAAEAALQIQRTKHFDYVGASC